MKNRIISLFTAGLLCISMASCTTKEPTKAPMESDTAEAVQEVIPEVAPYEKGMVENNLYTNKSIDLSLRIPTGWSAKSDYDLASIMGITYDFENPDKYISDAATLADIYDFMAADAGEDSHIIVLLQDLSVYNMDNMTAAEYLEKMKEDLTTDNATYQTGEVTDVSYSGNTYAMMKADITPKEGEDVIQYFFVRKAKDRTVTVMMTFPAADPINPDTVFA